MISCIYKKNSVGYNLSRTDFSLPQVKSINFGWKALRYFGPKIWNILPSDIKNSGTLKGLSKKIKSRIPQNCPCRIRENFIHQVGFTNILEAKKEVRIFNINIEWMLNSSVNFYIYLRFRCILAVIILCKYDLEEPIPFYWDIKVKIIIPHTQKQKHTTHRDQ